MNAWNWLSFSPAGLASLTACSLLACQIEVETPPDAEAWDPFSDAAERAPGADEDWPDPPPLSALSPLPSVPEARAPNDDPDAAYAAPAPTLPVGAYRELIALDPALVNGPGAANANGDAPWSFRSQMQWLAGSTTDAARFTRAWLERWATTTDVGPALVQVRPRPGVRSRLIGAWLGPSSDVSAEDGLTASNLAASTTYGPPSPGVSWADAPFRLLAIVNRVDLATRACSGFAGELRYVYGIIDRETGQPLDATLILEMPYPESRSAAAWALAWSELGSLSRDEYGPALEALTREVQAGVDPLRVRLRSNEQALGEAATPGWEMREFKLQIQGAQLELVQTPLEFTPRADADPAVLADYVLGHAAEIRGSGASLPEELRAGAAEISSADFSWRVLGVNDGLRQAFSVQTCNGCHGGDTATLPFRHIAADASPNRPARLSRFLYDPEASGDELRRRQERLDVLSGSVCDPAEPAPGYPSE
jgi:hypothetical protein